MHDDMRLTYRRASPQYEGKGREQTTGEIPPGAPGHENEDDSAEDTDEPGADPVFGPQEALGTLVDGGVNFRQAARRGLVVGAGDQAGGVRDTLRFHWDARNQEELGERPDHPEDGGCYDDRRCRRLRKQHVSFRVLRCNPTR